MSVKIPKLIAPPGYCPQAEDTSIEADLLDFYLLRQRSSQERLQMAAGLMQSARSLSLRCLRQQFAHLTLPQFARQLAETWLQEDCPSDYVPSGSEMTWIQDSIQLAIQLHYIFLALDLPYYVTGGVAAIVYGEPRTTRDLDVVIAVQPRDLPQLVTSLEQAGFYVPGVDDVLSGRMTTLQITQIATISRADLMIAASNEYEQLKFDRRRLYPFPDRTDLGGTEVYVASPEDVIVNKLRWGQRNQSDKQWRDVLGILKTQQATLDLPYIRYWASHFGLLELLESAFVAAGIEMV